MCVLYCNVLCSRVAHDEALPRVCGCCVVGYRCRADGENDGENEDEDENETKKMSKRRS